MPNEKQPQKELKVTDKRIFTPEGEVRDEFRDQIRPSETPAAAASPAVQEAPAPAPAAEPKSAPQPEPRQESNAEPPQRQPGERIEPPDTPFTQFIEQLFAQAAMSLGLMRDPYGQVRPNPAAARQLIDIISMLQEKTKGNLSAEEAEFLTSTLGELKLAYVQRTKNI